MNTPFLQSSRAKRLLICAETLFLKHGYNGTSLQMLIEQAGGSRRNIYAEFGNKQGLFTAVLQQKTSEINLILSATGDINEPRASLIKVCFTFLNKLLEPDMVTLFKLILNTIQDMPDIGDMMFQHVLVEGPKGLANYLQQLNDIGTINIDDPQHACHLLLGMVKGHIHTLALLDPNYKPTQQQISQQVEKAVDIFLNGVLT
jgi:TetR/AcrR family transcriptional repressor of mexJK operon